MVFFDKEGFLGRNFGAFGGRFVPETLIPACRQLEESFNDAWNDETFHRELSLLLETYAGRPSPITECERFSAETGVHVFLKREDLNHTGSHKINNVIGQVLLADRMGKKKIIAETGAGQHGVASATAAALMGFKCVVFMGEKDVARQKLNVFRMRLLGAEVRSVSSGSGTLKDAVNEAMREWVATVDTTYYCLGSVLGPHPYPTIVAAFQSVIGCEARQQFGETPGGLPDVVVACVGGGSNAAGIFSGFVDRTEVQLVGVEPAGGAALSRGSPGVLHGSKSFVLQDEWGQVIETESISAGLDYPGVGPQHAYWASVKRAQYETVTDNEVVEAFKLLSCTEGIIPALEPAHALAWVMKEREMLHGKKVLVSLSGRGDKDVAQMVDIIDP